MKPRKLVYGVGINNADYVVEKREESGYVDGKRKQRIVWTCRYYRTWKSMIQRCYSAKFQERSPTYAGCSVSEEWKTFSNFKTWMETQEWQDKQLDKDLLIEGNKVYGPETCVFVSKIVNGFTTNCGAARGEWMIGVYWNKGMNKFISRCSNPFTKKLEHIGLFTCELEAHQAWQVRKLELAHLLAAEQTDPRVATALVGRYSKQRE